MLAHLGSVEVSGIIDWEDCHWDVDKHLWFQDCTINFY